MSESVLNQILDGETLFLLVGGFVIVVIAISSAATKTVRTIARERSRREIAAYIAEGSLTPEQGERLMAAGKSANE